MRIAIDGVEWIINDWFADKEDIYGAYATKKMETEKAVLLEIDGEYEKWIPKSQMNEVTDLP